MDEKDPTINNHDHQDDPQPEQPTEPQPPADDATQRPAPMMPSLRQFIVYYKQGIRNVHGEVQEQVYCNGVKFAEAFIVFSVFRFDPVLGGYEAGFLTVDGADVRRIEEIIPAPASDSVN